MNTKLFFKVLSTDKEGDVTTREFTNDAGVKNITINQKFFVVTNEPFPEAFTVSLPRESSISHAKPVGDYELNLFDAMTITKDKYERTKMELNPYKIFECLQPAKGSK